jgi:tetratricopeptide (TPR) repeat protein
MFAFNPSVLVVLMAVFITLSGCATDKMPMSQDEFLAAMSNSNIKIESLLDKGNQEEAVLVLGNLAKQNPDRKEPWARMAKVYFDAGNYAQAIVSAEEVLQRDTSDRPAKSIRAVAGLRVAAQSLTDLRNDVELKGNARSDAAGLAKVMRETLGEDVLVPPEELEERKKREAAAAARTKARLAARKKATTESVSPPAQSGGDPFNVLK